MRRRKPVSFKAKNRKVLAKARKVAVVPAKRNIGGKQHPAKPIANRFKIPINYSEPARIRPFICTCDKRMDTFRKFIKEYSAISSSLLRPIVYYSGNGEEYHQLIDSINPIEKIEQNQENGIQYNAIWEFPRIINEGYAGEYVLFLEDDLLFSSGFPKAIREVDYCLRNRQGVDLITLYGSGDCYWPEVNNKQRDLIYRFSGHDYYGNLAVVFHPRLMRWWFENREKVWHNKYSGWDIKIGYIFEDNGFSWYCTDTHYVQHQIGKSAISGEHKSQASSLFRR